MRKKMGMALICILITSVGIVTSAQAQLPFDVIRPENITATASGSQWGFVEQNTINLSGLDPATLTMHDVSYSLMWNSPGDAGSANPNPGTVPAYNWIRFDFDRAYQLTTLWVWNFNGAENTGPGVRNCTIEYSALEVPSADPNDWTLLGDFEFAEAPGMPTYTGRAEADFAEALAQHVVNSIWPSHVGGGPDSGDWGSPYSDQGLSEVRFFVADVLPTTLTIGANPAYVTSTIPAPGEYQVENGASVPINAQRYVNCPDVQVFDHWEGDGVAEPGEAETTVLMDGPRTVTAFYVDGRACPDECHVPPAGDVNIDCQVNLEDFGLMAGTWLACTSPDCD